MMSTYGCRFERRSGGVGTGERSNMLLANSLHDRNGTGEWCGDHDLAGPLEILPVSCLVASSYGAAAFHVLKNVASLKPERDGEYQHRDHHFPRSEERGFIEGATSAVSATPSTRFPRSEERGLIRTPGAVRWLQFEPPTTGTSSSAGAATYDIVFSTITTLAPE